MMRIVLWLLLLVVLAAVVLFFARTDEGYVLIVYPPWRVELSVTMAVAVEVAGFAVLYLVLRLLSKAIKLPAEVRTWRQRRRSEKAWAELSRAIAALLSGQPAHARKLAEKAIDREGTPMASLVAARAAAEVGDAVSARKFLEGARSDQGEWIAARQAIERLLAETPALPDKVGEGGS